MIRVSVAFPPADWAALPRIRSAARGLSRLPGLMDVRLAVREEPIPGAAPAGPVAEIAFATAEDMRKALAAEGWERFVRSGGTGDAPSVRAYVVGEVVLGAGSGGGSRTTDIEVAAEEVMAPGEAEPLSTQMHLPLSRPAETEGGNATGVGSR